MAKLDPAIRDHLEWIGYVQPTGLVVSAPALVRAGAILNRRDVEGQRLLRECVEMREFKPKDGPEPWLPDFRKFTRQVLGWSLSPKGYAGTDENPVPPELDVYLPKYGETLKADYAVRERDPQDDNPPWQLLVTVLEPGDDFEQITRNPGGIEASAHGRLERLLRETGVKAGLLFNGQALRLLSAPTGESSGWMDFRIPDMVETSGRPILAALRLLMKEERLLSLPRIIRLAALLENSRKYQNEVSERLGEQVLHALYELLRGFQAAHDASHGKLLKKSLTEQPDQVYHGLLTVILRLIFLLFAEEREILPEDDTFIRYYSLSGLYERLREDAALYPDTMDQRYGAWAQLLVLFRLIHDGASSGALQLPKRQGILFNPDRFPFLEGRINAGARQIHERLEAPLVPDGTVYRILEKLLVLDGERISYRALDVEQIGSIYEMMMGFRLETARGLSAAVKVAKQHGAPATIDLEMLLEVPSGKRRKWFRDRTDRNITDSVHKTIRKASTIEDLHAALETILDKNATPDIVSKGAMVLQPSEERRRSGSHYTPRPLTEPIVRKTLEPILAKLQGKDGQLAHPEDILDLKVCDPAMGSGAFLVEVCRQLADTLVEAWRYHDVVPEIPPDEDETIFARRLIAQRCLYGVDRNPVAVDLAKVSLWLVTLAKEHSFSFLDHALRHGDSLVGLSREHVEAFHWNPGTIKDQMELETADILSSCLTNTRESRELIRDPDESVSDTELRDLWDEAQFELSKIRLYGDLLTAAFFEGDKPKHRETVRNKFANEILNGEGARYRSWLEELRQADPPLAPFHWELEFPEVFERENPGFDAFVGNPPFAGKNTTSGSNVTGYPDWLKHTHPESHGNADLVAHFFRRTFNHLRRNGALGLIATNTIAQGDTRSSGLRWICNHDGDIYWVNKRIKWPGLAAVVVSVVNIMKGKFDDQRLLDNREVDRITAFLFHRGDNDDPVRLTANIGKSFVGSYVLGMGFTFDDTDKKGVASSLAEMERLIAEDPRNQEVIFPYIGGAEVNNSPTHSHHRYVINFDEKSEEECRKRWPDLMTIVEEKVKPTRMRLGNNADAIRRKTNWWHWGRYTPALNHALTQHSKIIVQCRITSWLSFAILDPHFVFDVSLNVFPISPPNKAFSVLQSRPHEIWARFFGSSLEDRLRYTPSDCFETFPFPEDWQINPALETTGQSYYDFRAELMVRNNQGLTKTYNRFHDPYEHDPEIRELRELHAAMDRAVLDAYGWNDIPVECEFILDYEINEEEWSPRCRKPYRYRWPDKVRDEVLARLLELNADRAREEARSGLSKTKKIARVPTKKDMITGEPEMEKLF